MTKVYPTRREACAANAFGLVSNALVNAYRERRRSQTVEALARLSGICSGVRLSQLFAGGVWFALCQQNVEPLAKVAAVLGLPEDTPLFRPVPQEWIAERAEQRRVSALLPPSPRRVNDRAGWDQWHKRVREIIAREAAGAGK